MMYNDENEIYAAYTHGGQDYTQADITIIGSRGAADQ